MHHQPSNALINAFLLSEGFVSYREYQKVQDQVYELKQRVDPCSEDCCSIADSLEKEYSSERRIRD
jgi:hypothetical protein